ncbi:histidine phosphatase superfamily [Bombardia bombarda]|uniref:Histidine phosphatase superfamily n=1 Tax=Bombardia bombarda TaxID=252184 RepID=A0AA39XI10_9PEZI|nr:histidine phosphatase superfamily [Bombardia bombarda]
MRLILVRHGETVDNVAGLYAGVRNSPLTAHGVLQARRLAEHLASRSGIGPIRHIFSSDLQRAADTAQAIIDAQQPRDLLMTRERLQLVKVPELRERDFQSAEGKRFGTARADAETHEEMRVRADRFVRHHLAPLLSATTSSQDEGSIVIVSHGILLNSLFRVLLMRYAPSELSRMAKAGPARSEYLVSWSNTGYLEAIVTPGPLATAVPAGRVAVTGTSSAAAHPANVNMKLPRVTLVVLRVNVTSHLEGLKKTRGGIGSAQFDTKQRTMDSFLQPAAKKPRFE